MLRPPVSIWSPDAEALAQAVEAAGWPVRIGGLPENKPRSIAVIDARDDEGAARLRLASATAAAVRLVLVGTVDPVGQDRLIDAGATQIAMVGADGAGLAPALRLATAGLAARRERRARRLAAPALERWIEQRLAGGVPAAVIRVAIVRLDLVNAAHGRERGTALVAAAERRIATQVAAAAPDDEGAGEQASALIARIDGPAFAIALTGSAERVVVTAARIEEALAAPFRLDDRRAVLGTRLGLASARPGDSAASLLARAAAAMAIPAVAGEGDDALSVDIHRALAGDEIAILYQPQAPLTGGAPTGVEALARWQHPELGTLGAETLLAAAARAGIETALSDHIQRRVLAEAAAWPAPLAALHVALNLTAADLARPGFVEILLARIDASGLSRRRLTLEVTETELMTDLDAAAGVLAALQAAGCRTAIDDFGTGYSSLAYLASLPIDYLKLDRSLAREIVAPGRGQVVVRGAIEMGRRLGVAVVAEGVESEEQRVELAQAGCAIYQGFLLAPPLSGKELAVMMTA